MNQHLTTSARAQTLRSRNRSKLLIAGLLAALGLAACGGGGDSSPAPVGNVGPAGATVTSSDGKAALVVPAGAVSTPINVTLTATSDGFSANPLIVAGTTYRLDAPDTVLAQEATLEFALPAGTLGPLSGAQAGSDHKRALAAANVLGGLLNCDHPIVSGVAPAAGTVCFFSRNKFDDLSGSWCRAPATIDLAKLSVAALIAYDFSIYSGLVEACEVPAQPVPRIANLSLVPIGYIATIIDPAALKARAKLPALLRGVFGVLLDKVPPTVTMSAVTKPDGSGNGHFEITGTIADNVGVANAQLLRLDVDPTTQLVSSTVIGALVAGPYAHVSPGLPLSAFLGQTYVVRATDAAGNVGARSVTLDAGPPTLSAFSASPATVPFGGGNSTLSWSTSGADTLTIDNGVGDVAGLPNKIVNVTAPTTFTLTAANANGTVTATTAVSVGALAAPTITSFSATPASLPVGGGAVTLNWATTGTATLTIDNGVGVVTGTSKVVNVTANTTFTLTASNASGSPTQQTSVVVATSTDRFVDPTAGLDTNSCAQAAPCLTVAKAMTGAPAGSTVYLADGSYSANTQPDAIVPDGVTLRATNPGAAVLAGFRLTATGSATFNGVVVGPGPGFSCTLINAISSTGTPTLALTGVQFRCSGGTTIGGKVKALMTPGALVGGLYTAGVIDGSYPIATLSGTAELLIQGGVIDGNNGGLGGGAGLLSTLGNSKLTLDAVTMRNRQAAALVLHDTSTIVMQNGTLIDSVGVVGTYEGAVHIMGPGTFIMDHAQISNLPGIGILVDAFISAPTLQFTLSTITHAVYAIRSAYGFVGTAATVTADGLSLINNANGIGWYGTAGASFDLRNSTISGNTAIGILVDSAAGATFKLRGSTVSGNTTDGLSLAGAMTVDLGTVADAGGNTFTGNGVTGLHTSVANTGLTVNAVGNTWAANEPAANGVPATNSLGKYPASTAVTGPKTHGKNFKIDNGATLNL